MKRVERKIALRCAVYTRVSTNSGLEQDFNSLDNQREASEAYIKSQAHEGWKLVRERYDDGGLSGGSMERPAVLRIALIVRADDEAARAERPLVGRQKGLVPVLPHVAVDVADLVVQAQEARNAAQNRGLAASRRAEQRLTPFAGAVNEASRANLPIVPRNSARIKCGVVMGGSGRTAFR